MPLGFFSLKFFQCDPTLSRCASPTRTSPDKPVKETDFGAENVAFHPARCSKVVPELPWAFSKVSAAVSDKLPRR